MSFKNKVAVVTGGTGFIGSHVVDALLEQGAEKVIAFDNLIASSKKNIAHINDPRLEFVYGDVRDRDAIQPIVKEADFVFHLAASKLVAAMERPRIDMEVNIGGAFNILEAARDTNVRIVHASTGSVLGSSDKAMPEDAPKNPTTLYGISKLSGEMYNLFYAKEFGVKTSVIRYFHVYGPRQDYSGDAGVVSIFLSRVLNGKQPIVYSGGEQIRCFTYIKDDVDATLLLAKENAALGKPFNVASPLRMSINELAQTIIKKYSAVKGMTPKMGDMRVGENPYPVPDTTRIESLGWKAKMEFEDGLDITKKWVAETEMQEK